mgnify:CR=1 FL=1
MIQMLYDCFKHWSSTGSVWIISDTHFEDDDCKLMDSEWITPEEHIKLINEKVHKNDYLIHLGDVGNPEWLKQLKCRNRVLIMGNHDQSTTKFKPYFNEIYTGPLFIAEKILLSHEPIKGLEDICFNIHGHDHGGTLGGRMWYEPVSKRLNLASNVVGYTPISLAAIIKAGYVSSNNIKGIHRATIDYQTEHSIKNKL